MKEKATNKPAQMTARKHSRHQEILILYQNQNVNTKQETMKLVFFHLLKKASAQNADFNILGGMKTPAILEHQQQLYSQTNTSRLHQGQKLLDLMDSAQLKCINWYHSFNNNPNFFKDYAFE